MIRSYREEYEKWLNSPVLTREERAEIAAIGEDEDTKKLRFGLEMSFGTAGLRSTMDMGPGCMNVYTVAQTTQALAELTASRFISLTLCVLPPSFPLRSLSWAVLQASISPRRTIPRNTTAIRHTGRTGHSSIPTRRRLLPPRARRLTC